MNQTLLESFIAKDSEAPRETHQDIMAAGQVFLKIWNAVKVFDINAPDLVMAIASQMLTLDVLYDAVMRRIIADDYDGIVRLLEDFRELTGIGLTTTVYGLVRQEIVGGQLHQVCEGEAVVGGDK